MLLGAVAALLVAVGVFAWAVYLRPARSDVDVKSPSEVIVVVGGATTDGPIVAQLIARLAQGRLTYVSPDTTTTISGTSYSTLRDAYAFGGAAAIARAVAPDAGSPVGWVDVGPEAWTKMVDSAGGATVTVPVAVHVFDGSRLLDLDAGEHHLAGHELASLLLATDGLPTEARSEVKKALLRSLFAGLSRTSQPQELIKTNLDADYFKQWVTTVPDLTLGMNGSVIP
jgi:anionic cell wall polymer biosynthesis LytR-Cps2A-Psr (LCP) family protein